MERILLTDVSTDHPPFYRKTVQQEPMFATEFEAGAVKKWIRVIPWESAVFRGGKEFRFGKRDFEDILRVFSVFKSPQPVDWEHSAVRPQALPIKTAGWFYGLGISRDDGLYALCKLTAGAVDYIRSNGVYVSPAIEYNTENRVTGHKERISMTNFAFTVLPAIDNQTPVLLSDKESKLPVPNTEETKEQPTSSPPAAPEQKPEAQPAEIKPSGLQSLVSQLCEAVGCEGEDQLAALITDKLDNVVKVLKGENVVNFKDGCAGMSPEQKAAVAIAKENENMSAIKDKQIEELTKTNATLQAQVNEFTARELENKITNKVTELFTAGKLTKELEAPARELFASNWELGEKMFSRVLVPIESQAGKDPGETADPKTLNDEQKELFSMLKQSIVWQHETDENIAREAVRQSERNK